MQCPLPQFFVLVVQFLHLVFGKLRPLGVLAQPRLQRLHQGFELLYLFFPFVQQRHRLRQLVSAHLQFTLELLLVLRCGLVALGLVAL